MKNTLFSLFLLLLIGLVTLSACQRNTEPAPTEEAIYQPTRSIATLIPPTKAPTCNNVLGYISDAAFESNVTVAPGTKFLQQWEVLNYSDCNWDEKYRVFFISGNQMGAPDFVEIPHIPIGSRGKISVELTAPEEKGEYRSEWKLFDADNRFFGESLVVNVTVE